MNRVKKELETTYKHMSSSEEKIDKKSKKKIIQYRGKEELLLKSLQSKYGAFKKFA